MKIQQRQKLIRSSLKSQNTPADLTAHTLSTTGNTMLFGVGEDTLQVVNKCLLGEEMNGLLQLQQSICMLNKYVFCCMYCKGKEQEKSSNFKCR